MPTDAGQGSTDHETQRLAALDRYQILDTAPEKDFDDLVAIAAQICDVPIALITLIDGKRQWFKAAIGLNLTETSREIAFCSYAIEQDGLFVVEDASEDARFIDNPLVTSDPNFRSYAGTPLETADGLKLGTLCVLDTKPRQFDERQRDALEALGRQVMKQLELRHALAKLRSSEVRHQRILESAIDYAIVSIDLNGRVTSWNEGAHRIMGWTEEEMCGQLCDAFFTPQDRENGIPDKEMSAALSRGRGTDERWRLRKDGSRFWATGEMMTLTDEHEVPVGFLKILRDRTEQHQTRIALEGTQQRFQLALDAAGFVGSWDWDIGANRLTADAHFAASYSVDPEEAQTGLPIERFIEGIHPDDRERVLERVKHCIEVSGEFGEEYRLLSVDGAVRWVFARGRCLYDDKRRPTHFPGVAVDITDRKQMEDHQRLLTGELQHRIKNTLAVVQAIVSQSLRTATTPDDARDAINNRLVTLSQAHDLLTQTSWTAAPIRAIIAGASRLHAGGSDRIAVSGPITLLNARAALALTMVIHELCTNAAKYGALSVQDGSVTIDWIYEGVGDDTGFTMVWQEHGGPVVRPPSRKGFDTRLIETSLGRDLGGSCRLAYLSEGVRWTLKSSLASISENCRSSNL